MPWMAIEVFTTTITIRKMANTSAGAGWITLRSNQSDATSGTNTVTDAACNTRIVTTVCRWGVIAAQMLTGINREAIKR